MMIAEHFQPLFQEKLLPNTLSDSSVVLPLDRNAQQLEWVRIIALE